MLLCFCLILLSAVCLTLIPASGLLHLAKQIVKRLLVSDFPVRKIMNMGIFIVEFVLGFLELDFWFSFHFPESLLCWRIGEKRETLVCWALFWVT